MEGFETCSSLDVELPAEPRIEILTSGTTGPPKHFAISFATIARHHVGVHMLASSQSDDPQQLPPMTLFFPLGNISGIYSTIPTLLRGRRAELSDRFTVTAWHQHVLRYRPGAQRRAAGGGVQMVSDDIPAGDLSSIRFLSTGAAPLDPDGAACLRGALWHPDIALLRRYRVRRSGGRHDRGVIP